MSFRIGQRIVCVDDEFLGENGLRDPLFAERCPHLPVRGTVYIVRGFVDPYLGYLGPPGLLLKEIVNTPCDYSEGEFEPSFSPRHFRPLIERKTDIAVFARSKEKV